MVVISEPIPTLVDKDKYLLNGWILSLNDSVAKNPEKYNSPSAIMEHPISNLIYEYGFKIMKPLYDNIDKFPKVCLSLVGGMIKLGLIRNFFKEENRGNIIDMVKEYKDFYIEYNISILIRNTEKNNKDVRTVLSMIKSKEMKDALANDIRYLIYPIFETIDTCPYTCCAMICDLVVNEKMVRIFDREDYGKIENMVKKYKTFYIQNKMEILIEKLATQPVLNDHTKLSIKMKECIDEILSLGEESIHAIYKIIDSYPLTCLNLIPIIVKKFPFDIKNIGINILGTSMNKNITGMVGDFKKWYNDIYSKQTV